MTTFDNAYKLYWDFFTLHFIFKPLTFSILSLAEPIRVDDLKQLNVDQEKLHSLIAAYQSSHAQYLMYIRSRYDKQLDRVDIPEAVTELYDFITNSQNDISKTISKLPNTIEKAEAAVKAYVNTSRFRDDENVVYRGLYLLDTVEPSVEARIFRSWKENIKHKKSVRYREEVATNSYEQEFFWFVRTGLEDRAIFSRYAVKSVLEIDTFPSVFMAIEDYIEESLLYLMTESPTDYIGERWSAEFIDFLFKISKDKLLSQKFKPLIRIAVRRIKHGKVPQKLTNIVDILTLARSAIILSKFAESKEDKEIVKGIANLLAEKQLSDGSWDKGRQYKLFMTLSITEAIIRSGLGGVDHTIDNAIEWLMRQQKPNGTWDDEDYFFLHFPEDTVDVILLMQLAKARQQFRKRTHDVIEHNFNISKYLQNTSNFVNSLITMLHNQGANFEKAPSTYEGKSEEDIRDLFVVSLKGHFNGFVGGEIFNKNGKTDILISSIDGSSNVLIVECKFWRGLSK